MNINQKNILSAIKGKYLTNSKDSSTYFINSIVASDIMSDILINQKEDFLLITSQTGEQVIRTANIMNIKMIIFVNGKIPAESVIKMAENFRINLITTSLPTFECCIAINKAERE